MDDPGDETKDEQMIQEQADPASVGYPSVTVLDIARDYKAAGVSVFPVRCDGSKAPAIPSWTVYRNRFATDVELQSWFTKTNLGIGIVCGVRSGGLEVFDFDDWTCFEPWKELCDPSVISWLPVVETAGGGFHVLFRCREIAGNIKLASHSKNNGITDKLTRIETRGEGGYIVGVGSPLSVHTSGNPYVQVSGPVLPSIPTITPDERKQLWTAAESFDNSGRIRPAVEAQLKAIDAAKKQSSKAPRPDSEITPWDDFDKRGDLSSVLSSAGWTPLRDGCWSRPRNDGNHHTSAKIVRSAATGDEVLTVFSSNVPESIKPKNGKAGTSYGAFQVFKTLIHNGDAKAATKAAVAMGYGSTVVSDVDLTEINKQAGSI